MGTERGSTFALRKRVEGARSFGAQSGAGSAEWDREENAIGAVKGKWKDKAEEKGVLPRQRWLGQAKTNNRLRREKRKALPAILGTGQKSARHAELGQNLKGQQVLGVKVAELLRGSLGKETIIKGAKKKSESKRATAASEGNTAASFPARDAEGDKSGALK